MSFSGWTWMVAVAVVVVVVVVLASGLHWTVLDLVLDQLGRRGERWRNRGSESPGSVAIRGE